MTFRSSGNVFVWTRLAGVVFASALAACSDTSGTSVSVDPVGVGRIVNPTIVGIAYETATRSGVTDATGAFEYLDGETVRFFLGATELTVVPARAELNWFELAGLSTIPVGNGAVQQFAYRPTGGASLDRVGAMAALLTTIDADRNPDNGIDITAPVRALFADVAVDMTYAQSPTFDPGLKRLLRQAARDGVLPPRRPRNGGYALADIYAIQGVDPSVEIAEYYQRDINNDGTDDSLRRLTYSAAGKIIGDSLDNNADGVPDTLVSLAYDDEGYGSLYATDSNADGATDRTRRWVLDAFGDVERYEEDDDADGTPEFVELREINSDNLRVRREVINNRNGTHTVELWFTDTDGNRTSYDLDRNGDGTPDTLVTMTYGRPLGPWLTRTQDDGRDGTVEQYREREYDSDDRILRDANDTNGDGNFDRIETWTYDANGLVLTHTIDADGDGAPDSVRTFNRSPEGLVLSSSTDSDGDGSANQVYFNTFNADGQRTVYEVDTNGDGTIDRRDVTMYNASGQQIEYVRDSDNDGQPNTITTTIYDGEGRAIRSEVDIDADGTLDRVSRFGDFRPVSVAVYY